eukprot:scaffold148721_cov28-Tisochrysis_lutea.AAC.4
MLAHCHVEPRPARIVQKRTEQVGILGLVCAMTPSYMWLRTRLCKWPSYCCSTRGRRQQCQHKLQCPNGDDPMP